MTSVLCAPALFDCCLPALLVAIQFLFGIIYHLCLAIQSGGKLGPIPGGCATGVVVLRDTDSPIRNRQYELFENHRCDKHCYLDNYVSMSDSGTRVGFQMGSWRVPEKVAESDTCTQVGSRHLLMCPICIIVCVFLYINRNIRRHMALGASSDVSGNA